MTTDTCQSKASLYDSIPYLDSWYQTKDETYQVVPCVQPKKRKTCNAVSFSTAPPAVYCYQDKPTQEERPVALRRSSSEQVKGLIRFCTNKFSRRS
ncbi:hypothetical protein A0J61_05871 [Choanephora cucurbitarum]|uniref:Uncharacterized protein n=1 Tax=Choanephora cucurbitarum TaxID=101091 RepID=A0A1C7NBX0_9FUNG|nr:hypothetical protein A0J61_05871 [Choanephora cucurbitarum]